MEPEDEALDAETVAGIINLLMLASPLAVGRRLLLALGGAFVIAVLHGAGTGALIWLGWAAPRLVPVFQIVNDFVSLAAGPTLWLLLARPSPAWFARPLDRHVGSQIPRSARNLA